MRNALHGREIDMMKTVVEVPHMLGITPIGKLHDPLNEEMTLLDPKHQFWKGYESDVRTKNAVMDKIQTAIRSLRKDGTLRKTYPYGEEAEIVYIEVDRLDSNKKKSVTQCKQCGKEISYGLDLVNSGELYFIETQLDCPSCDFSQSFKRSMRRQ